MSAIENLEIVVEVDIASAIAELEKLQEELGEVAQSIEGVDVIGTEGIDIRTSVDEIDDDLAKMKAKMEAFEAANGVDLDTDFEGSTFARVVRGPAFDIGGSNRSPGLFTGGDGADISPALASLRRRISGLIDSVDNFELRMSDIHNLLASLVPLLLVFIGAVPAVVTALVGLAAAAGIAAASLAAITGFGALGVALEDGQLNMDNLTEVWEDIRDSFIEAFAPLAERLSPLFLDAVDGLERFFQAIANEGDALMALTDEARSFGNFMMDFFPDALRTMAATAEALAPLLADIGRVIERRFNPFMRALVELTADATPIVAALVETIANAIPTIIEIGIQFAYVANFILHAIGAAWTLITAFGHLDGLMGFLIGTLLVAVSTLSLLSNAMSALAAVGVTSAYASLLRFMTAVSLADAQMTVFGSTTVASVIGSLISLTSSLITSAFAFFGVELAARQAAIAAATFWSLATLGLAIGVLPVLFDMAAGFLGLSSSIDQATSSLKEFDRVSGRMGDGFNPYGAGTRGAAAADPTGSRAAGGPGTVVNIETTGDRATDKSNARYGLWLPGRTSGGTN